MSGEDMASNYSFGEYDDFSEYDIITENDHSDSESLYAGSGAIPKSNILVLSDIEESFVVLGRDILTSIREFSSDETPEPTPSMNCEENSASATSFPKEIRVTNKILAQSEDVGVILKNTKKPTSNLKDVTERFRSTSSPLLCDWDSASPSNEAFFHSIARNHPNNVDNATDRQNKLLKGIKQILQQKVEHESEEEVENAGHESEEEIQKVIRETREKVRQLKVKENFERVSAQKAKVPSLVDNLNRRFNDGSKATNRLEHQDQYVPSKMTLKNDSEIFHDADESRVPSLSRNESNRSDLESFEISESLKVHELKKIIDECLLNELIIDNRSKQLLCNFKNSIEIFENSYDDDNSKAICDSDSNEFNFPHEYKGLVEKNSKVLNYAILINCIICFVFMICMYFWGVMILDLLQICDKIIDKTSKIEKFHNNPFNSIFSPLI